jgi:hypothetical protein
VGLSAPSASPSPTSEPPVLLRFVGLSILDSRRGRVDESVELRRLGSVVEVTALSIDILLSCVPLLAMDIVSDPFVLRPLRLKALEKFARLQLVSTEPSASAMVDSKSGTLYLCLLDGGGGGNLEASMRALSEDGWPCSWKIQKGSSCI